MLKGRQIVMILVVLVINMRCDNLATTPAERLNLPQCSSCSQENNIKAYGSICQETSITLDQSSAITNQAQICYTLQTGTVTGTTLAIALTNAQNVLALSVIYALTPVPSTIMTPQNTITILSQSSYNCVRDFSITTTFNYVCTCNICMIVQYTTPVNLAIQLNFLLATPVAVVNTFIKNIQVTPVVSSANEVQFTYATLASDIAQAEYIASRIVLVDGATICGVKSATYKLCCSPYTIHISQFCTCIPAYLIITSPISSSIFTNTGSPTFPSSTATNPACQTSTGFCPQFVGGSSTATNVLNTFISLLNPNCKLVLDTCFYLTNKCDSCAA